MQRTLMLTASLAGAVMLLPGAGAGASARGGAQIKTCGLDRAWLLGTVEASRYELAGAKIALARSPTPAVRQLAETLTRDHARSLNQSGQFLRRLGLTVPSTMDPAQHWKLHMVSQESGAAFDRDYAWLQEADHVVAIGDARAEAQDGCNATVRTMARNQVPYLRLHLRLASTWQTGPKTHS